MFAPDLATLWREGGLDRVVSGKEVRVEAAPGGVDVEPLDEEAAPVVLKLLGAEFDLAGFRPDDPVLVPVVARLRGFRPPLAPDPFEMLVGAISAQQISLKAARAIQNRFIERFGARAEYAYAFPAREVVADSSPDDLTVLGFSRSKARSILELARTELDLHALSSLPDHGKGDADAAPGDRRVDRGLVPRTAPREASRLARGDLALRYAVSSFYGDGRVLTIEETRELGERFEPFQNLTAHYLLVASRNPG